MELVMGSINTFIFAICWLIVMHESANLITGHMDRRRCEGQGFWERYLDANLDI